MVVGCIVERGDEILLCRRAIEPARGRWTIPAGFLELGEGIAAGARRETLEESGADVEIVAPHAFLDLPHIGQSYAVFRARLLALGAPADKETLEIDFVARDDIPWDALAFPVVHFALKLWADDRRDAISRLHTAVLTWNRRGSRFDVSNYELTDHLRSRLG